MGEMIKNWREIGISGRMIGKKGRSVIR